MGELSRESENVEDLVRKINAGLGPRDINLSVDACGTIPVTRLAPGRTLALSERIVDEIFREAGIPGDLASPCWDAMVSNMLFGTMLQKIAFQQHRSWRIMISRLRVCKHVQAATKKHVSMSAPDLALVIAALLFRKMKLQHNNSFRNQQDFIKFFGYLNCMRWLPVAIKVYSQTSDRVFLIELDEQVDEPLVRSEEIDGRQIMVVTTKTPTRNIYEAEIQKIVRQAAKQDDDATRIHGPDSHEQTRKSIEKVESDSAPSTSVAPSIKEQSPDENLELQPDRQLNSDTLRDHARNMKVLGKRLASPEQKFVRQVRRDIRRFANLADEREDEMALERSSAPSGPSSSSGDAPQTCSSIDLFGRYKMLWKGILRENGSIPDSLRELVRHDCDQNQIFYLEETEADFLAANTMRDASNAE